MENMTYKKNGEVGEITLCSPKINKSMVSEMMRLLEDIQSESNVSFVVIRGSVGCFSEGFNFRDYDTGKPIGIADFNRWEKLSKFLQKMNQVTIAVVDGVCKGAGIQLMLACDFRIASANSEFLHNELGFGYLPSGTVLQLGKYCGLGRALELIDSMCPYNPEQAKQYGIINEFSVDVESTLQFYIERYSELDTTLLKLTRRLVHESFEMSPEDFLGCSQAAQYQAVIKSAESL